MDKTTHLETYGLTWQLFVRMARFDRAGMILLRLGLVVVLLWIGGIKFADYEAESIVPFVSNSPLMSFFYAHPAPEYKPHMSREGEVNPANHDWHESNRTYSYARGLGVLIMLIGVLIALHPMAPQVAAFGSLLLIAMSVTTLSFLVTTPEVWVPALGSPQHGFPYLSGAGRLVVKDMIMLGAAVVTMAHSARSSVQDRAQAVERTRQLV